MAVTLELNSLWGCVVSSSFLEIAELANGDIVLQRADQAEDAEPLVVIRFSDESSAYMNEQTLDVAKVMIQAGIQAVASLSEQAEAEESAQAVRRVVH